ncbi:FAD-dependent oxidoreductase, partial [Acinetobacter baumannii]
MEKQYDVVVIGAGPAGLSAAIAAAESGGRILILDNNPQACLLYTSPSPRDQL